jgi:small nuclear ribonucleoprotein (snRNP)-like protein
VHRRVYKALLTERVIVNLRSGKAFAGVVWEERFDMLVLRDVTLFEGRTQGQPMDGEVVLDRQHIDFIQIERHA